MEESSGEEEDFENYADDDDGDVDVAEAEKEKEVPFRVLDANALEQEQNAVTDRIASLTGLPRGAAELLLMHYKWNEEKLQQLYFEDESVALKAAGVVPEKKGTPSPVDGRKKVTCLICWDEVNASDTHTLSCGHQPYCDKCIRDYLSEMVHGCGRYLVRCPWPKCVAIYPDDAMKKFLTEQLYTSFRNYITKTHIESHPKMRWCSNPKSCGRIVEWIGFGTPPTEVTCSCGFTYCWQCGHEKHNPVTCDQVRIWEERGMDPDARLTMMWIRSNTKPCPLCNKPILKNEGCNHMTCRKPGGCGHEFCWLCREDWSTHGSHTGGYFSCNKYESSKAKQVDAAAEKEKAELDRYLHYYNRFFNYESDLKLAEEKRAAAKQKMALFKKEGDTDASSKRFGINCDFIAEAVEVELLCRRLLKYTYIIAYFLTDGSPEKEFFQFQQANLEGITERLADMNKQELKDLNDDQLRTRIRTTKQFQEGMQQAMAEAAAKMKM
eukprot:TRINITY_DN16977_c0_g1_i1.p1 TRINITY_DN16977_c0_g1~~TRINITY_DN16977_c0_g1_i1.p1  ORF type:complete len:502 (-),score=162.42 TRINITY_DN16977_c0_g1_i1:63-1544(-)